MPVPNWRAYFSKVAVLAACSLTVALTLTVCGGGSGSSNTPSSSGTAGSGSGSGGSGGSGSMGGSGSGGTGGSGGMGGSGGSGGSGGTGGSGPSIPAVQHFAIVVLENLDYSDVVGSSSAPYINSLIAQGGLATQYYANTHPSIGNYFTMTTGEIITNDDNYTGVVTIDNVVRELQAASKSWKVYAQSLPSQGYLGGDVYPYLHHHNPISYFSDVQPPSQLNLNIVNFSQLASDLANGQFPAYSFIVPDAQHDAHDCPGQMNDNCDVSVRVAAADTWLSQNIPQLLTNPQFQQSGILVITTDESRDDNRNGGGMVATVVVGTSVKAGYQGTGMYDHRSLLGLSMTALGVSTIPNGAGSANQMTEFFE